MSGKILIIDDVAINRIVYKVKLAAACYEPVLAADGATGLDLALHNRPDLIMLSLLLPDMKACDFMAAIRNNPVTSSIPIVVIAAEGTAEQRLAALNAGADEFMIKTTDDLTLMARLRNLLRAHEELAELEDGSASSYGFAEQDAHFAMPASIALVTQKPETALRWRRDLSEHLTGHLTVMPRQEALAMSPDARSPDIFVIEASMDDPRSGLLLMSELRSHSATRHSSICMVIGKSPSSEAAIAFDMGADDLVHSGTDPREFGLRLSRLLARKRSADRLRSTLRNGVRLAMIDPLTGLHNRRYAIARLAAIAEDAYQDDLDFAVMVVDLDRFKQVNDQYGHAAGDAVLIEVAKRMSENLRSDDLLARIGGEEFLIALPKTGLSVARKVAERLCTAIEERQFSLPDGLQLSVTASIGLALGGRSDMVRVEAVADIIGRADRALLSAKSGGRNQVTICATAA